MGTSIMTLEDLRAVRFASAAEFGPDKINDILTRDLAYFNGEVAAQMAFLATPVTVQSMVQGASQTNPFTVLDEFGKPISRNTVSGSTVSFPLVKFVAGLGWTSDYLMMATPAEIAEKYLATRRGYAEFLLTRIKKALYGSNANFTFVDSLTNGVSLAVKRLWNADGTEIPEFNSKKFVKSTHSHYLATAAVANADVDGAITHVTEHGYVKNVKVFINSANYAAIAALSKFKALDSTLLAYSGITSTVQKLEIETDSSNRCVGLWDSAYEVWVKDGLCVEDYLIVTATGENEKALAFRQLPATALQGLRIKPMFTSASPLVSQEAEGLSDFGVLGRGAASVLYLGGAAWSNPTL